VGRGIFVRLEGERGELYSPFIGKITAIYRQFICVREVSKAGL
jgi:hypothetical protein